MFKVDMLATGKRMQARCKDAGYSSKDLSILLNVDLSLPHYWFTGKAMPSWNIMVNLAVLLECKIDDLLVIVDE